MSTNEVFMIPDNRGSQNSFDPNLLLASMMNGNNGFGGNGSWMWVIFLFFLYPLMRNGGFWGNNGFGGDGNLGSLGNLVNNDAGRELLMQAINGNNAAIRDLASMTGAQTSAIQQAICSVNNSITSLSGQVGMSGQQIINSIQQGNIGLASQLAQCCCDLRTAVTTGNYENQIINGSVMTYNNGATVVCETKQGLISELENTLQQTKQILADRPKYEQIVRDCESLLKEINPVFAKDKERDDRINSLDTKVTSMEGKLDKILNVLSSNNNPNIKL